MRLGGHFTWLNKIAIFENKVTITLMLICHYFNNNEYSHLLSGDIIS